MRRRVNSGLKKVLLIYGGLLLVLIITCVTVYIVYNNKIKESARQSLLATEKITELVPNNNILEEASSEISRSINEVIEETTNEIIENETQETEGNIEQENTTPEVENPEPVIVEEPVKPLEFVYPVEGEILKSFAMENLVFSETLQEWVVHKGIDIKAPRTTIVKAAEEGTVKSIKNDPRYGLTVVIEHQDGFSTSYSNLLTAEFIKEGEEVEKGQTIGTVGNTATFEIADESHLHFEILQNNEAVDPTMYIK